MYLEKGNEFLAARGTIELSYDHAKIVSERSKFILEELGCPPAEAELAEAAGFLHDIGNVVNRYDHGRTGALISYKILNEIGMPLERIVIIMGAIGNHEETTGHPVNTVAAAVIIADKSELHRDRVRKKDIALFSGRDRVNYAVEQSLLQVDKTKGTITLAINIDQSICSVMEYFEIFLPKMLMCRRAAEFLGCQFKLIINNSRLL
jgi:CRISPR/Cas system-associated endonuclease Cas3-HD